MIVEGDCPKDAIAEEVRKRNGEASLCYEAALKRTPGVTGAATLRFRIDGSGAGIDATPEGSTIAEAGLERCLAARLRMWTFPATEPEKICVVRQTWEFRLPK